MKNHCIKRFINSKAFALSILFVLLIPLLSYNGNYATIQAQANLDDANVGVFNAGTLAYGSDIALGNMFEWMGATVIWVDGPSIRSGILNTLDILAFPGGSMASYALNLTEIGMNHIRQFIANGGSYFGICGGALFATQYLGLCSGSWNQNIPGISSSIYLIEMTVNQDSTGPDLSTEPVSYMTLYWGSSYFTPTDPNSIIPIMSYQGNDEPGMFVTNYGSGTVFVSSPHPEYEEGDQRDGTPQYDYLNDPDTEWDLLYKVTEWLIATSPAVLPHPLAGLPGILIIGIPLAVIIAVSGILYYRRRQHST